MKDETMLTEIQQHIMRHVQHGKWDELKSVDQNISVFNMQCLVGMIETGEATFQDIDAVGGRDLVAAVAKQVKTENL